MSDTQTIEKAVEIWDTTGELVPADDPRSGLISINPERHSGTPVFVGTRVPVKHLWDYLETGEPLDDFLEGFPGVTRDQAIETLELAFRKLLEGLPSREDFA